MEHKKYGPCLNTEKQVDSEGFSWVPFTKMKQIIYPPGFFRVRQRRTGSKICQSKVPVTHGIFLLPMPWPKNHVEQQLGEFYLDANHLINGVLAST